MKAPVSLGFRTPANVRVRGGAWVVTPLGRSALENPDVLPDWDYFTTLGISREMEVDLEGALDDCGLPPSAQLGASIAWHSSRTNLRGATESIVLHHGRNLVSGTIDGKLLGGRLTLEVRVVLKAHTANRNSLAPHRPGSSLWLDSTRIQLEGAEPRFPILPISFAASGIAGGRQGVWALLQDQSDLSALALGSIRLYLNTDHPAVKAALEGPDSPEAQRLQDVLRYDTARQLIVSALANDDLRGGIEYDEGSLGELYSRMISSLLGQRDVELIRAEWRVDPGQLEAELQAALRLFQ